MFTLPPLPNWEALHPAIVHFPIALLVVAPLFIILGTFLRSERGRPFLVTALILMALGTVSTFVAVSTGEAAKEAVEKRTANEALLEQHEELAETVQIAFSGLTVIYAAMLFGPRLFKRPLPSRLTRVVPLAFLVLYSAGVLVLLNAAHQGGRLVHDQSANVHAPPSALSGGEN